MCRLFFNSFNFAIISDQRILCRQRGCSGRGDLIELHQTLSEGSSKTDIHYLQKGEMMRFTSSPPRSPCTLGRGGLPSTPWCLCCLLLLLTTSPFTLIKAQIDTLLEKGTLHTIPCDLTVNVCS